MSATLYFHGGCFDGIASAALATWLRDQEEARSPVTTWRPVDYRVRSEWLSLSLSQPSIVVDFLYHPGAEWWWDHHRTTFLRPADREGFSARKSRHVAFDPAAPACAKLIIDANAEVSWPAHLRELARWATKTDSADYESPQESIECREPALRVWLAIQAPHEESDEAMLVRALGRAPIDDVADLPRVRELEAVARRLQHTGLTRLRDALASARLATPSRGEHVCVFEVDENGAIVNRFAPFSIEPGIDYYVGLFVGAHDFHLRAMRNRWKDEGPIDLGQLAARHGGGGHHRIGSISFGEDGARARAAADAMAREIEQAACSTG